MWVQFAGWRLTLCVALRTCSVVQSWYPQLQSCYVHCYRPFGCTLPYCSSSTFSLAATWSLNGWAWGRWGHPLVHWVLVAWVTSFAGLKAFTNPLDSLPVTSCAEGFTWVRVWLAYAARHETGALRSGPSPAPGSVSAATVSTSVRQTPAFVLLPINFYIVHNP